METFRTRDGNKVAYYVDDFTDPWLKPDTMLLLHPAMSNARRWFRWVPRLSRHFRVVRMEFRGHGQSEMPGPNDPFSLGHLVGDALELLDRVDASSAHVVGYAGGGYAAQQLAIHHGSRVKSLALYASTPGIKNSNITTWIPKSKERGLRQFLADTITDRFDDKADPKMVKWWLDQTGSNDPEFISKLFLHMSTHDFMEDLPKIKCPTLIVAPAQEHIGHTGTYHEMQKRIAGSELIQYDTSGHNLGDAYPDRCVDDLFRFLRKNRLLAADAVS